MTDYFKYKKPNFAKLVKYGFAEQSGVWKYTTAVLEGEFDLTVYIAGDGGVETKLIDREFGEPYTLHLVEDAAGEFVGRVRGAVGDVLADVAARCFETWVFQSGQTQALISHIRERYGREPEYLWERAPDCAVWRRADNAKWFGIIMTLPRTKLGLSGEDIVEILDVRAQPEEIERLVDGKRYFRGWHMNKKHWLTVPLDFTLSNEEVFALIEKSFSLAKK